MLRQALLASFLTLFVPTIPTYAAPLSNYDYEVIPRFQKVAPGIYRGGRPLDAGVKELASYHFKTIINLEDEQSYVQRESTVAKSLGIQMISTPMNAGRRPNDAQVDQILRALQTPSLQPIFIHCKHGQDRTGMMVGLYRVLVQRWSAEDAYNEMLKIGFHPEYRALDQYFRDRAGM